MHGHDRMMQVSIPLLQPHQIPVVDSIDVCQMAVFLTEGASYCVCLRAFV